MISYSREQLMEGDPLILLTNALDSVVRSREVATDHPVKLQKAPWSPAQLQDPREDPTSGECRIERNRLWLGLGAFVVGQCLMESLPASLANGID
ncbi:MAG: hypothetical protein ACE5IZ_06430, partial [Dehalococcoidia bacterium]